jgi:hypothetical protein
MPNLLLLDVMPLGNPHSGTLPEGYTYHPEGYLWYVLPAEAFADLPAQVTVHTMELFKKSEFHVTVLNARAVARAITNVEDSEYVEKELQALLKDYVCHSPMRFEGFLDDLRLAVSADRTSIAARCVMSGLDGYAKTIERHFGYMPQAQPAHVSLYTASGAAVGINTENQMESYEKLDLPDIQRILNTINIRHYGIAKE